MDAQHVSRADYGVDAPPVVRNLSMAGALGLLLAAVSWLLGGRQASPLARLLAVGLWPGASCLATALVMLYGSRVRKLQLRDRLLDGLGLRGDEQVLDVGCGRGLMLLGAARRLAPGHGRGRAVGIDLWQSADQSGNHPDTTRKNAAAEGVTDRVELHTGDARRLPFADGGFDLVLSSWALHNIPDAAGREQAVRELARVLKPGGRALLVDIQHTAAYARTLRACGLACERRLLSFLFVLPSYLLTARKPAQ